MVSSDSWSADLVKVQGNLSTEQHGLPKAPTSHKYTQTHMSCECTRAHFLLLQYVTSRTYTEGKVLPSPGKSACHTWGQRGSKKEGA